MDFLRRTDRLFNEMAIEIPLRMHQFHFTFVLSLTRTTFIHFILFGNFIKAENRAHTFSLLDIFYYLFSFRAIFFVKHFIVEMMHFINFYTIKYKLSFIVWMLNEKKFAIKIENYFKCWRRKCCNIQRTYEQIVVLNDSLCANRFFFSFRQPNEIPSSVSHTYFQIKFYF